MGAHKVEPQFGFEFYFTMRELSSYARSRELINNNYISYEFEVTTFGCNLLHKHKSFYVWLIPE